MVLCFQVYKKKTEAAKKEYLKALAAYRASLVSKVLALIILGHLRSFVCIIIIIVNSSSTRRSALLLVTTIYVPRWTFSVTSDGLLIN